MNLYELAYSWYEDYSPTLFTSDQALTEDEWKALCDSLLPQVIEVCLKDDMWLGWCSIVNAMVPLLVERGFAIAKPVAQSYWGSNIIGLRDGGHSDAIDRIPEAYRDRVCQHNRDVNKRLDEEHAAEKERP